MAEFLAGYFVAATTNSTNNIVRAGVGIAVLLAVQLTRLRKVFLHDIHGMHGVSKPGSSVRLTMTTTGAPNTAASA